MYIVSTTLTTCLSLCLLCIHVQKAQNGLHDENFVFDIPDHIWEQLNESKEVTISVPSQPMPSDSSELRAIMLSSTTSTTGSTDQGLKSKSRIGSRSRFRLLGLDLNLDLILDLGLGVVIVTLDK